MNKNDNQDEKSICVLPNKLEPGAHGPYTIQRVYQNGTIDVARNAQAVERINIRHVIPFRHNW